MLKSSEVSPDKCPVNFFNSPDIGTIHQTFGGRGGGGGAVTTYARPSPQCRPRRIWGHASPDFFFINLIEYGVSFCILKYKSLSLYL